MDTLRSMLWPTSRLGKLAVATASASAVGLWIGTVVPERVGWSPLGMAGASAGLVLGIAGGILALAAIWLRDERALAVVVAFLPFAGSAYLIRRSMTPPRA